MPPKKDVWGLRLESKVVSESASKADYNFLTYISPYAAQGVFITNETLRRAILDRELKEGALGTVGVSVNKKAKVISFKGFLPLGGGQFTRLGLGGRVELLILESLQKKYPRYRFKIGKTMTALRLNQYKKRGLESGQTLALEDYIKRVQEDIKRGATKARVRRKSGAIKAPLSKATRKRKPR